VFWVVIISIAAVKSFGADPLSTWNWRNPNPQGSTLRAATFGNGLFVAVGDNGTIIASGDGYHWTTETFGVCPHLLGVAYAAGEYAAVGANGVILISSNAVDWMQLPVVTSQNLNGIAGNSRWREVDLPQFLAVGDAGVAVGCTNNTNWFSVPSGTTNSLNAAVNMVNYYMVVGHQGTIVLNTGSYFEPVKSGTTNNLYAAALADNGNMAAVGDLMQFGPVGPVNGILYSTDLGFDWTNQIWNILNQQPDLWFPSEWFVLHGAAYGTNGFVAVGNTGHTIEFCYPGVVFTSATGTNWIELPAQTFENSLWGAAYGKGLYVLVGEAGSINVSSNLVNWSDITGYHRSALIALACGENLCLASGRPMYHGYSSFPDFTTLVSTNGRDFSPTVVSLPTMNLASDGSRFVGVSGNTVYATSDGYNWHSDSSFTDVLQGITFANGYIILVGGNGGIYTSTDSTNWSNHSAETDGFFYGAAYGNNRYVAAGTVIATSANGVTWSVCASNPPAVITRIVYGRGLFVATGYTGSNYNPIGEILTSLDGCNWQVQFIPPYTSSLGIAYSGGTFLAIGDLGAMYTSSDGTNWTRISTNLPLVRNGYFDIYYGGDFATVCANQGSFLAGGLDGVIIESGNTWLPATLSLPQAAPDRFRFSYLQQIDVPYRIQASTNLVDWETRFSGIGSGQTTNFTWNSTLGHPAHFFRLVSP